MKRILCVLISCLLILNSTLYCYADAGAGLLTVAGGSTLVGAGLTGEALATVASTVLPPVAIACALALTAYGANIYISDKAQAEGVTKQTYIENKLLDYAQIEDNFILSVANGISVTTNGIYQWSKDAFNTFSDFVDWLSTNGDILSDMPVLESTVTSGSFIGLPFVNGVTVSRGGQVYKTYTASSQYDFSDVSMFACTNRSLVFVAPHYFRIYDNGALSNASRVGSTKYYYYLCNYWYTDGYIPSVPLNTYGSFSDLQNSIISNGVEFIEATDVPDGAIVAPNLVDIVGVDAASLGAGTGADVISLGEGIIEGVNVANPSKVGEISVGEYTGVVDAVIEGNPAISLPSVGSITIPQGIAIPRPRITTKEESTPIANNGSLPIAGSLGGGVYTFDLTEIFPFCLPFDLAHLVGKFQGEPVAPHWEIPFKLQGFIDEVIVLDFDQFDGVARIFRLGEDIIFIACLIFISRKLIMS